jgi:hypothetical protein
VRLAAWIAALALAATSAAAQTPNFDARLQLSRQLEALNAELLSHASATAVLQAICDRRAPGAGKIRARKAAIVDDPDQAAAARRQLGVGPGEPVRHRRVELLCGEVVFSRADNWYLPNRLTPLMNTTLQTTERPFGVVVAPLAFQRRTLAARLLFEPLPADWEEQPKEALDEPVAIPARILQHRALLQTPDGRPFSYVVETYTSAVLR